MSAWRRRGSEYPNPARVSTRLRKRADRRGPARSGISNLEVATAIAAGRPLMLTYSPRPITPQIIAALEQIESPAPAVRDAALKSISVLLPDITLAELFTRILDEAALAIPWWQ